MQNHYNSTNENFGVTTATEDELVCAFFTYDLTMATRYYKQLENIGIAAFPGEATESLGRSTRKTLNIPVLVPDSQYERASEIIASFEAIDNGDEERDGDDDLQVDDDDDLEPDDDVFDDDDDDDDDDDSDDDSDDDFF